MAKAVGGRAGVSPPPVLHPLDEPEEVTSRRTLRASPDRGDPVANAVVGFMPNAGYLEVIESVRRARQEVLRKRREAAAAAAAAERAERERAEREAKERARAHEEAKKARRKEVVQELISRDAQLETFRAQIRCRAAKERERRAARAEEERRSKYGPLKCSAPDVGLTLIVRKSVRGVEIAEVDEGSLADKAGLAMGEVIVEVNSRVVLNAKCARVVKLMNGCDGLLRLRVAQREDVTSIVAPPGTALRTVLLKRPRATVMCTEITPETLRLAGEYYELNLAGKGLTSAPSELGAFANVQVLDLADNAIERLPQDLGKLSQLTRLDCSSNKLVELPESIGGLTRLTSLYLFEEKQLKELPETFGGLQSLVTLNIPRNGLTRLPDSFGRLTNLATLWASENQLTALPDLAGLTSLTRLVLDANPFGGMPETLQHLVALETLSVKRCGIPLIPGWIDKLQRLTSLNLSGNHLVSLPDEMGSLSVLKVLDLGHNRLRELPPSFGKLEKLEELYLQDNRLEFLPPELFGLSAYVHGLGHVRKVRFGFVPGHTCRDMQCCGSLLSTRLEGGAGQLEGEEGLDESESDDGDE